MHGGRHDGDGIVYHDRNKLALHHQPICHGRVFTRLDDLRSIRAGGTTASGAVILATESGVNSIIAVDTGGTLANTISSNSTASGRRVQMPLQCGVIDPMTLTANAQTLLQRIVLWAALIRRKARSLVEAQ